MLYCKSCKHKVVVIYQRKGPHFAGHCKTCGTFLKYVPHKEVCEEDVKDSFNKILF